MTQPQHERSHLPPVEEVDVLSLMYSEVVDVRHDDRWEAMTISHPLLAREILRRAAIESAQRSEHSPSSYTIQEIIANTASYVVAVLEAAAKRQRNSTDGDVGDEDQPPSA